jgi:hypothetical protein
MSKEELFAFAKRCFYEGFEACENDDANCFTAWRERSGKLIASSQGSTSTSMDDKRAYIDETNTSHHRGFRAVIAENQQRRAVLYAKTEQLVEKFAHEFLEWYNGAEEGQNNTLNQ